MTARERMVRVVAEVLKEMFSHTQKCAGGDPECAECGVIWKQCCDDAERVVAAMEAEMGLRVEAEPISNITISGPGGSLTVTGPLQHRLVSDWVSDDEVPR